MKGYKEIRPKAAQKGDIIKIYEAVYKEPKDGRHPRRWNKRFTNELRYYIIADTPNNHGYCTVKSPKGTDRFFSLSVPCKAYRKESKKC